MAIMGPSRCYERGWHNWRHDRGCVDCGAVFPPNRGETACAIVHSGRAYTKEHFHNAGEGKYVGHTPAPEYDAAVDLLVEIVERVAAQHHESVGVCAEDGFTWPCETARIVQGEW